LKAVFAGTGQVGTLDRRWLSKLSMPASVEEVGLALVVLSLVFACAALIRRWSLPLRKLFIPTAGFFDRFPLFPFTLPAAVIVQLYARRWNFEWAVNRRAVEGIGGMAIDGVIICAVGTLSLGAIGANVGSLIILAIAAIGWSVFVTMVIGWLIARGIKEVGHGSRVLGQSSSIGSVRRRVAG
jgi:hypothetical protein